MPRTDASGTVCFKGHVGTTYRAGNAVWTGHGSPRIVHLCRDGSVLADRGFSKIRGDRPGAAAAAARITAAGAPDRERGESPAEWLARALASPAFRRVRHPGVRTYVLPMDPAARRIVERAAAA
jgi:hypothetical protein